MCASWKLVSECATIWRLSGREAAPLYGNVKRNHDIFSDSRAEKEPKLRSFASEDFAERDFHKQKQRFIRSLSVTFLYGGYEIWALSSHSVPLSKKFKSNVGWDEAAALAPSSSFTEIAVSVLWNQS